MSSWLHRLVKCNLTISRSKQLILLLCRFATQWPNLEVLKGVWSDFYTSYRRLQAKITQLKVKVSELNTPPVTTKIIASQKGIMKVRYHVTVMESHHVTVMGSHHVTVM